MTSPTTFPVRGVPGGWRDPWEDDDVTALRAEAERAERQLAADILRTRRRLVAERKRQKRQRRQRR